MGTAILIEDEKLILDDGSIGVLNGYADIHVNEDSVIWLEIDVGNR